MIRFWVAAIAWVLGISLWNYELIGMEGWWIGCGCGMATAWAWSQSRVASALLGLIGVIGLISIAVGVAPEANGVVGRTFFNGMSLGFLLGWVLIGIATWPRSGEFLHRMAEYSDDQFSIRLLRKMGIHGNQRED